MSLNQYTYCHNDPISYDDPTGQWIHIAIGAFIGGAISASIDAVSQVVIEKKSLNEVNWTSVKISAGEGAIAGAIGAATGGASLVASASKSVAKTVLKNVAIDAGVSFGSSVASQAAVKGKVNLSQAVSSAAMSAVSFVGGTAAKKVTAALKETNAVKAVTNVVGKATEKTKNFVAEKVSNVKIKVGSIVNPVKQNNLVVKQIDLQLFAGKSKTKTGKIIWPPNGGAVAGTEKNVVLTKGYQFDRHGFDEGTYVAPKGTPYEMRSLAPGTEAKPYKAFEVVKPIRGKGSITAGWFNQTVGGLQFELEK